MHAVPSMLRLPVGYRVPLRVVNEGSPPQECTDVADIRESLDQLDRRLDELRRQVAALTEDPHPGAPLRPPPARHLQPVPIAPPELIDPHVPAGPESPPEPVPGTQPEAPHQVATEIHQLVAVRDQLLAGARELVRAYERQLDALEHMAASGLPSTAPDMPASGRAPAPPPGSEEQARPAFFEGTVALAVSGAHRIQTIEVLEDALSRARHVDQVYVRRCHRGQVRLELTLSAGAELLGELNRVLPFPFAVTSATGEEIAVVLEGER
jgi:hypothetical protein